MHLAAYQFDRPDWGIAFDTDPAQAVATRKRFFDQVSSDRVMFAGMHVPFPGFGHLVRNGEGYRFVPADWQYTFLSSRALRPHARDRRARSRIAAGIRPCTHERASDDDRFRRNLRRRQVRRVVQHCGQSCRPASRCQCPPNTPFTRIANQFGQRRFGERAYASATSGSARLRGILRCRALGFGAALRCRGHR